MKYYDFKVQTVCTFEERCGPGYEFDAALGCIVVGFSLLERTLSNVITLMLGVSAGLGEIVTAELSFRNKVNLFASLFKHGIDSYSQRETDIEQRFEELMTLINKAEELRNKALHSLYVVRRFRVKTTAKARKGLQKKIEKTNENHLLDVADFIFNVASSVEEFPLFIGLADHFVGDGVKIIYSKGNKVVVQFNFL